jgi:hypothetical protein
LFGRNTVGENVGVSRGPERRTKRQHQILANYKLYVLAPAFKNSQRCGQSENAAEQEKFFCKKVLL